MVGATNIAHVQLAARNVRRWRNQVLYLQADIRWQYPPESVYSAVCKIACYYVMPRERCIMQ